VLVSEGSGETVSDVEEATSGVGEFSGRPGSGDTDGVTVSGTGVKVGSRAAVAGTQAVKKASRIEVQKPRRNMSELQTVDLAELLR
jgi:hypothetical protein